MQREIIRTDNAPLPAGAYSQAVKVGDTVYVAGTCPFDVETGEVLHPGDIVKQTQAVLDYIDRILKAAGGGIGNVVKVTSFIHDLGQFRLYNEAYGAYFPADPPARSTIEVSKLPPGMCVEIECVAVLEA